MKTFFGRRLPQTSVIADERKGLRLFLTGNQGGRQLQRVGSPQEVCSNSVDEDKKRAYPSMEEKTNNKHRREYAHERE